MTQDEQKLRLFLQDHNFGDADFEFHFTSWLAENKPSKRALKRFYQDARGLAKHLRHVVRDAQLAWLKRRDLDRVVQNALCRQRKINREFAEWQRDLRALGYEI